MEQLSLDKKLVIGGGFRNGKLAVSMRKGSAEFVRALHADHEEADTRLLLHAKHATKDVARVVVQSPDTDVLFLSVSHCEEIECRELWFRTGVEDRTRYIPVHKIAARLGKQLCKAIPAFHALTGCDSFELIIWNWKAKCVKGITQRQKTPRKLSTVRENVRFRRKNG